MIDLKKLTIKEAGGHLAKGDFSAAELTQAHLDAIEKDNPNSNTYLEVFDDAMDAAHNADRVIKDNTHVHPLTGIPIMLPLHQKFWNHTEQHTARQLLKTSRTTTLLFLGARTWMSSRWEAPQKTLRLVLPKTQ